MKDILYNLDPKVYDISAFIVGFALIGNFNANEQNAIGNWFITVGQILENNSAWQQVVDNHSNINNDTESKIETLEKTLNIIQEQLKNMK